MSDIHSTEEAYERIAEALNYLEEHGDEPHESQIKHDIVVGKGGVIRWSPGLSKWVSIPL